VKAAKLDWLGVFEYSDVDNAESYGVDEKVDARTITEPPQPLMAIQKKISRENLRAKYLRRKSRGSEERAFTALIDVRRKETRWSGSALESMAPEIDGKLYLTISSCRMEM